jgi:hypothetical protein
MAMDIELRNQLGALTAQVQELTKQSKNLDSTLAGALNNGAKSAGGLAAGTRAARVEMTMAEQVSTRIGRAWASQMFSLATGAFGVTAIWQQVAAAMDRVQQKAAETTKATSGFYESTRLPGIPTAALSGVRNAMRSSARGLTMEEQQKSIKSFVESGGTANEAEVGRLGTVLDNSVLMGFSDQPALAKEYGRLRKMGVSNPEDVIISMITSGKADEIGKLKPGQARAMAQTNNGAWNKARADTRNMPTEDKRLFVQRYMRAMIDNKKLNNNSLIKPTMALYQEAIDAGIDPRSIPVNVNAAMSGENADMTPGAAIAVPSIDQPAATNVLPPAAPPTPWQQTVRKLQPPSAARAPVAEVRIVGDSRPVPVNAGD